MALSSSQASDRKSATEAVCPMERSRSFKVYLRGIFEDFSTRSRILATAD